jgi:hypothetical protein
MSSSERPGRLKVRSVGARIEVLDAYLRPVATSGTADQLDVKLPPGAYSVSARIGGARTTQGVLLRPGARRELEMGLEFDAAAPVGGTQTLNETHAELARQLTRPRRSASGAALVVMLRGLRGREMAALEAGFEVYDASGHRVDVPEPQPDPHASGHNRALGWRLELPAGGYRLRWVSPEQPVEHAVWLAEDHQTVIFVPQGPHGPVVAGMSMHLLRRTTAFEGYGAGARDVEVALSRMRSGLPPGEGVVGVRAPLMLTLLTALHLARETSTSEDDERSHRSGQLVQRLQRSLGDLPDVVAIAGASGSTGEPVPFPPMLAGSLELLLRADRRDDDVIPEGSLTELVSARRYSSSPWLLWEPIEIEEQGVELVDLEGVRFDDRAFRPFEKTMGSRGVGAPAGRRYTSRPASSERKPPPPAAVDRVEQLVSQAAPRLKMSPREAADRLGTDEISQRLGMPRGLVARCLDELDT